MEGLVLISEPEQNWTEARQYCRQHHTDLASIRNHKENSRLARILRSNFVWIGLHRTRMWSDQSNSSFRYWKTEAPYMNLKHLDPSCTAVSFDDVGRWTDENCDITLPFICYTALSGIPHQYYFVQASKNWTDAQRFCRRYYTDLATVDGIKDMKSLLETANGTYHGSAWIGLFDDLKTSWQWSLEDPQFYKEGERDFRKWFEHPLNENGTDFCALMLIQNQPLYEGQWIDRSCEERHQFVCYNENSTTPGTYVPISEPKTWTEAQSYCREHFVDLASVRNQQENMDIFTKTSENIIINFSDGLWPVWIGLYRTKTWSDKSNSSFTYWMEGEPDNGRNSVDDLLDQHCTVVSLGHWGQWSDENCLSTFPFICYSLNSTAEPLPAPGPTLEEPPATSDPAPSTKRGDAHTAVAVIGLRAQVSSQKDQSEAEIEKLLVMKLQEELLRRGIPHKFTLRVKSIHKIIL
ncbi:macrophage mannose receptor 1-like [Hoplias malabaricus]|uniref:macrophage mannose receptor 1-like n=1 Tax=Hoplias malabaricus TaxID=27720 RepID=UPI00346257FF